MGEEVLYIMRLTEVYSEDATIQKGRRARELSGNEGNQREGLCGYTMSVRSMVGRLWVREL